MIDPDRCLKLLTPPLTPEDEAPRMLAVVGFQDAGAALRRLRAIPGSPAARESLARTLPALLFALSESATPDASLMNLERLVRAVPDADALLAYLAENPRAIEILVRLFVGSQYLTEILLRNPQYLPHLTQHKRLAEFKYRLEFVEEGARAAQSAETPAAKLNALRRFQQWELLRLAACDSFGLMDFKTVTLQLALLADSLIQNCLAITLEKLELAAPDFAVLALGKLGGEELNYSSDIDLIFVCESDAQQYWGLAQHLIKAIAEPTSEGFLYRVDMRLRPWGSSGALVTTTAAYADYLRADGRMWEKQALLKARPVAGNAEVAERLLRTVEPIVFDVSADDARENVRQMKQRIETGLRRAGGDWGDVKGGAGSIRDIEFVTQFLQLAHGRDVPEVRSVNTLDGLVRLADRGILPGEEFRRLTSGYVFLRTIEHALQLLHNKPSHALPQSPRELTFLARRLDFPDAAEFVRYYDQHCRAVRQVYERHILLAADPRVPPVAPPPRTVAVHLGDAAASYAELFSAEQAERHLQLFDELNDSIARTQVRDAGNGLWELTIVGYDQLGDLSLMSGLLLAYGLDIESGLVLTGDEVPDARGAEVEPTPAAACSPARRRKYVNVFRVRTQSPAGPPPHWKRYETDLIGLLGLAAEGQRQEAQGRLAKRVAAGIGSRQDRPRILLPVEIDIDNSSVPQATVLHIRADDTTGFLYEFTSALALSAVSIQRVWIQSEGTQVLDTLWIVDAQGRKIVEPRRLNELRAAVVLIKHFTHLLPRSSNPEAALLHFREFLEDRFQKPDWVQDLTLLQNSEALDALARLLGVSDFLWHDFLKLQHSNLFPVVADIEGLQAPRPREALHEELAAELDRRESFDERRDALNAFKDREMLRVDMRHILGLQDQFGMFSQELTDVAEVVVAEAFRFCTAELQSVHGSPSLPGGGECRVSLCALGKFGGLELGFASDIELMFVYEGDGDTSGPQTITNLEYFDRLVDLFRKSIRARRKGIFEIDLRLRPFGKAGSLAVSFDVLERYFGPEGAAWPFERQALVKLRPVAGDEGFGRRVIEARDAVCYSGRPFDVTALRAIREKQVRQLVQAGRFNAKLSPGGLVDCEYLVQALQMTWGHRHPEIRATNTRAAIRALEAVGLLTSHDRYRLRDAYRFLRRVIDALRMVRGDARDLTIPPADSEEYEFLARRLEYGGRIPDFGSDLERHVQNVRELSRLLDDLGRDRK